MRTGGPEDLAATLRQQTANTAAVAKESRTGDQEIGRAPLSVVAEIRASLTGAAMQPIRGQRVEETASCAIPLSTATSRSTGALFGRDGTASWVPPETLRKFANLHEVFRSLLIWHEQVLLAQAQRSAGCNASHLVEARMCRWLLRIRDLAQRDNLALTQEFLAQMFGFSAAAFRWSRERCKTPASSATAAATFKSWMSRPFVPWPVNATRPSRVTMSGC